MRTRTTSFLLICICLFSSAGAYHLSGGKKRLPNYELTDLNGNAVLIRDYTPTGKLTVMSFFTEMSPETQAELSMVNKSMLDWKMKYHADFVAVSMGDKSGIPTFRNTMATKKWKFDVLWDETMKAKIIFDAKTYPITIVVDDRGYIIYQQSGWVEENISQIENSLLTAIN